MGHSVVKLWDSADRNHCAATCSIAPPEGSGVGRAVGSGRGTEVGTGDIEGAHVSSRVGLGVVGASVGWSVGRSNGWPPVDRDVHESRMMNIV